MNSNIELELSPNDHYVMLNLINDRIQFWEDRENLIGAQKDFCPSEVEYDDFYVECRIRELRALRSVYLAAVRKSCIQT